MPHPSFLFNLGVWYARLAPTLILRLGLFEYESLLVSHCDYNVYVFLYFTDLQQVDNTQILGRLTPQCLWNKCHMISISFAGERDLCHVYRELISIKANYYQLGIVLGLPPGELSSIRKGAQDIEQAFSEVLVAWLKNVGVLGPPTWRRLVEAVDSPAGGNHPALAMSIAKKHLAVASKHIFIMFVL